MIYAGLCSVTFRPLSAKDIIDLSKRAGIACIEWGGDIHVPHGDVAIAKTVRAMSADAGLRTSSYGSYYRVGIQEPCPFEAVLESALALGSDVIRVWAGKLGTDKADAAYWDAVIADSQRIGDMAAQEGITIAYEYHPNTLTDTDEAALRLLKAVDRPNVRSYWQFSSNNTLDGMRAMLPWLVNLHVQANLHRDGRNERIVLAELETQWLPILEIAAQVPGDRDALIEFVKGDTPEQFVQDAQTLKTWLDRVNH